jgi:hypothetical protein
MNKTFPAALHPSGEPPLGPHTLGTLAAALVTCEHPEQSRVSANATSAEDAVRIDWCAACGSLRIGESQTTRWQSAAYTSLLTKKHFEEVVLLLHAIRQLTQLARAHASPAAPGSPAHIFFRNVRSSLSELSRLPLVRDVDRLEDAIDRMPRGLSPLRP